MYCGLYNVCKKGIWQQTAQRMRERKQKYCYKVLRWYVKGT